MVVVFLTLIAVGTIATPIASALCALASAYPAVALIAAVAFARAVWRA